MAAGDAKSELVVPMKTRSTPEYCVGVLQSWTRKDDYMNAEVNLGEERGVEGKDQASLGNTLSFLLSCRGSGRWVLVRPVEPGGYPPGLHRQGHSFPEYWRQVQDRGQGQDDREEKRMLRIE